MQTAAEDQVLQVIVDDLLKANMIEEGFSMFLARSPESEQVKRASSLDSVKKYFVGLLSEELQANALKYFVTCFHQQENKQRAQKLLDILDGLVENNVVPARAVCEALLHHEKLSFEAAGRWCQVFQLIRRIIGGLDYKTCRDMLHIMLVKAQSIPSSYNVSSLEAIEAIFMVIEYILNRNACLLPAYLAVNEITKLQQEQKHWPHWKLGKLLSDFVQTFRATAQMVAVSGRSYLLPIVGYSSAASNVWRLNPNKLCFILTGPLPYEEKVCQPQTELLRYVLKQPYSRDMVCKMLNLDKQVKEKPRCVVLEEQLVELVVMAMEKSEAEFNSGNDDLSGSGHLMWHHLSGQLIFFFLFQFASFPHMVMELYEKLKKVHIRQGRDHLMWILLQYISGSINKNSLEDFLSVIKLYDLLYIEKEPLPIPSLKSPYATHQMAPTCIWIHLLRKAESSNVNLHRPMPYALQGHAEFLQLSIKQSIKNVNLNDYKIAMLCNAFSTNQDYFQPLIKLLVESICGNEQKTTLLPGGVVACGPTHALPMTFLDSLTVHAKMSLIHGIGIRVLRDAQSRNQKKGPYIALSPALVETYSRLLVYTEIESLGIKGYVSQLLPSVTKSNAWDILHSLLEMFSYRLHHIHIQPHYRMQLLSLLNNITMAQQPCKMQLHLCIESTALHLIMGLGSWEVHLQLPRMISEMKIMSNDSEELNRLLVLTLARAMHVTGFETGTWCREILNAIVKQTPHSWSSHTLACFPPALADFFQQNQIPKENKKAMKVNVENEYRYWKSMASEEHLINHFSSAGTPTLFLCVLWRSLLEDNRISPMAEKVLDKLGPRLFASHLRTFSDYIVHEFSSCSGGPNVSKCIVALTDFIWKCGIISIDRFLLCLVLRNLEGDEAKVGFFVIQQLLKSPELRTRIVEFVQENSPEHWCQINWHEKHMAFHQKFPEKFFYEALQDMQNVQHQYLPVYFGNICLRFLPVFDIIIHRFLELASDTKALEDILEQLGSLYKFHDQPLTFLYNTLHYYEKKLRDKPVMKKKLIQAILGAFRDIRSPQWCVSEEYRKNVLKGTDDLTWIPSRDYYVYVVGRLVDTIAGKSPLPFPSCDWRFNEFPNAAAHALHATCIELMALPVQGPIVGTALLDIALTGALQLPSDQIIRQWINVIGQVLTALPETYWNVLHDRIVAIMRYPVLSLPSSDLNPFQMFNFANCQEIVGESSCSNILSLCHAVWQHASIGQLSIIPGFIREKLKPIIKTEAQYLYLCHLVGPFLQRFHAERTKCLNEVTLLLYEVLELVDHVTDHLKYMDSIADFLYHIKYMFVGDSMKSEIEKVVRNLRAPLQFRLRFIAHHGKDEQASVTVPPD